MSESKLQCLINAHRLVQSLRIEYDKQSCWFQCVHKVIIPTEADGLHNSDFSDAIFVGNGVAEYVCDFYKENNICACTKCKNHPWNQHYVGLANQLLDAKKERKSAFLNLIKVRQK